MTNTTRDGAVLTGTDIANIERAYNTIPSVQSLVRSHRAVAAQLAEAQRVIDWYADESNWEGGYANQTAQKARDYLAGIAREGDANE